MKTVGINPPRAHIFCPLVPGFVENVIVLLPSAAPHAARNVRRSEGPPSESQD